MHKTTEVIINKVIDLRDSGMSFGQVAKKLNRTGVRTARGKKFKEGNVSALFQRGKINAKNKAIAVAPLVATPRMVTPPAPTATFDRLPWEILTNSTLTDTKKVNMLIGYFQK